ncbi:MAG TPA: hypothetical protein VN540_04680 [Clostridia bacterium]|nr:hypothetical protein [Clostridia bacterium]
MGRIARKTTALLAALCLIACCSAALADVKAEADHTAVQAGDTVVVTFTVTGKNLAVAEGSYAYDAALLAFKEGDGVADGFFALYSAEKNGSSTLVARVTFTALAAGEATVEFTLQSLTNYAGKALDTGSAKAIVAIAAAPATPTPPPVDYSDPALSVRAENVRGAGADMYVWRSIENVTIPSRYSEAEVEYHGESVIGAAVKNSDAPTLLYLSDAGGNNAGYYVYDAARDLLYPYYTISSVSKSYIILEPDGSVEVPAGFTQTTLSIDGKEIAAWESRDAQGGVYLLYARNPDGEVGYYYYNPADESLQRYAVLPPRPVEPTAAPAATPEPTTQPAPQESAPEQALPGPDEILLKKPFFYGLCGAAALFLTLLITVMIVRAVQNAGRKKRAASRRRELEKLMEASPKQLDQ